MIVDALKSMRVARIDDGVRAKLVCVICGGETYVRSVDDRPPSLYDLIETAKSHTEH